MLHILTEDVIKSSEIKGGRARQFDIVCVEALDRISQDHEDIARIHKRLSVMNAVFLSLRER